MHLKRGILVLQAVDKWAQVISQWLWLVPTACLRFIILKGPVLRPLHRPWYLTLLRWSPPWPPPRPLRLLPLITWCFSPVCGADLPSPTHGLTCCPNSLSFMYGCIPALPLCSLCFRTVICWFHKYLLLLSYPSAKKSGPSCAVSHKPHCDLLCRLLLSLNTITLLPVISKNNAMYFCVSLDWWSQPPVRAILRKRPECCGQHAPLPPPCVSLLQTCRSSEDTTVIRSIHPLQPAEAFTHWIAKLWNVFLWNVWIETLHASHNIDLQQKHWQMNYENVLTGQKILSSSCFPRKKRATARGSPPPIEQRWRGKLCHRRFRMYFRMSAVLL